MLNSCVFIGRLTKDPDLIGFENENAVLRFSIAVQRDFKNNKGNYDADFISCVAWGKRARTYAKYLTKGNLISVKGSMRSNFYEDPVTNSKCYTLDLIIDSVDFLEKKKGLNSGVDSNQDNGFKFSEDPLK